MTVLITNYKQLTDVVGWVYRKNAWGYRQTRIATYDFGNISYPQLLSRKVHLVYPVLVGIETGRLRLFYAAFLPVHHAELSYDDWEDLFN